MAPPQAPLLSEIFRRSPFNPKVEPIRIQLGTLAKSLGVQTSDLAPFVRAGHLRKRDEANLISSQTVIDAPPEAAVAWMRSWFLPVTAKPLFSLENAGELLGILPREVLPLAARHDIPVQRDEALGFVLSVWAMRNLLLRTIRSREHAQRFDRQALLWMLLEKDPEKAAAPPVFQEEWEKELARVAKLEDRDVRAVRTVELMEAMRDAKRLAESVLSPEFASASQSSDGSGPGDAF